jgi:hypothetical protein
MKWNDSLSRPSQLAGAVPVFDHASPSPDYRTPIADVTPVAPTQPVKFPRFPTMAEMLEHMKGGAQHPLLQTAEIRPPSEPASLFKGMLGGNLPLLVQDSVDHPERYDPETQLFLGELGAGTRKLEALTPEEKAQLDSAVLDYASPRPRRPPPALPKPLSRARPQSPSNPYEPGLQDDRAPQVETAGQTMSSHWWTRGDQT